MKAIVTFGIDVTVEIPDDLPEKIRQLASGDGENYVAVDATDQQILERIAIIRGVRGFPHDECMTEELNALVRVSVDDEESIIETVILR